MSWFTTKSSKLFTVKSLFTINIKLQYVNTLPKLLYSKTIITKLLYSLNSKFALKHHIRQNKGVWLLNLLKAKYYL